MRFASAIATASLASVLLASTALAQFSPSPNPVATAVTGQRTLSGGTGTITGTGSITTSGGTAAVIVSGTATLDNAGTIAQTGSGRAIDSTANNAALTVTNSGTISAVGTDAFRVNAAASSVSLTNSGTIGVSAGGQAIDWAAITTGANTLTNQAGGVISAVGDDAVRPGQNGVIVNAGTIIATPTLSAGDVSGSDGIDLRTEKTVTVTNSGTITGRSGIATDGANVGPSSLTVTNNAGGVISAVNGSGLNVDANTALPSAVNVTANVTNAAGATIKGGVLAGATNGDGDGIDIDGVLTLNNAGDVLGLGVRGNNTAEGIAAGGGTIVNTATGRIVGSTLAADAPNGDTSRAGNGILIDDSNTGPAVAATTITNSGLIQGKSGFAIKMIGSFANTVTNNAGGTISGAGATAGAALQTGDGADTVINRGAIVGTNGAAIDLQGGNDSLTIGGGAASVTGSISGGSGSNTLTFAIGTGNSFSHAATISNFDTVTVQSGTVVLSGANAYTGVTKLTGGTLVLNGVDRLAAASALQLLGGTLRIMGAAGQDAQGFASLAVLESSTIALGGSTLTFGALADFAAGRILAIDEYDVAGTPDYAIRFAGDLSADATFLALVANTTINGHAAGYRVADGYTELEQVPEPASMLLFGAGVLGLAAVRRVSRIDGRRAGA